MRDLIRLLLVGIVFFVCPLAFSADKKTVLILPDNIVTESQSIDAYIYNQTAEFFANEIINLLNQTDYIVCPTVSEERQLLKSKPSYMIPAKNLTSKFKTTYNIDFPLVKKVANVNKQSYVLLLTSTLDSENYILRRTFWDFMNIPGATVIDPAYKISTYAVLIDKNNNILWSNTFYKTISVVESRIIPQGPSPQTEQLQKIRDYSRMLCPEIAENVQTHVLTEEEYAKETHKIYYDMGNFDNIFTKKYRRWNKEGKKDWNAFKNNNVEKINSVKERRRLKKQVKQEQNEQIIQQTIQTEVKAEPYIEPVIDNQPTKIIQPLDFEDQSLFEPVYIKRHWKNRLIDYKDDLAKPSMRGYERL